MTCFYSKQGRQQRKGLNKITLDLEEFRNEFNNTSVNISEYHVNNVTDTVVHNI